MSKKKFERILYYDEAQKAWVVDMMEVNEDDESDQFDQISAESSDSKGSNLAYA
jgi:hypothetical protein